MQDPILLWNQVALDANSLSHTNFADFDVTGLDEETGPTRSSRALAIVHLAMYDAYAGVINNPATLPRYLAAPPSLAPGASPGATAAAVAAAAHTTLSALYPSQKLIFDSIFAAGDTSDPGHSFGMAVAQAILADRNGDPSAASPGYMPSPQRGKHRVDPDNPGQGFHGAVYGTSKGFAITKRFQLAPPPFNDPDYVRALREVRRKGIAPELMGTLPNGQTGRTVNETLTGIYWGYDGMAKVGTPPRQYNQIVRKIAIARNNSVADNARLFALVNVAMADAAILAWEQKYKHEFWRPVVGIREHDPSMGPAASQANNIIDLDCDPQWLPLGAPRSNRVGKNPTPPFPAYPSGHATFGAAAFHITRLFYGDGGKFDKDAKDPLVADSLTKDLNFVSDEFNGVTTDNKLTVRPRHVRNFPGGLLQMIEENGRARVHLGVHWIFDAFMVKGKDHDEPDLQKSVKVNGEKLFFGGVPLGLQIAEDIFQFGGGLAPKKSKV